MVDLVRPSGFFLVTRGFQVVTVRVSQWLVFNAYRYCVGLASLFVHSELVVPWWVPVVIWGRGSVVGLFPFYLIGHEGGSDFSPGNVRVFRLQFGRVHFPVQAVLAKVGLFRVLGGPPTGFPEDDFAVFVFGDLFYLDPTCFVCRVGLHLQSWGPIRRARLVRVTRARALIQLGRAS